jgi:hypothetical protein
MKKPFKDTKFGKLLTEKLPEAAQIVGNVLPDKGLLGVVKNIIEGSPISNEDKAELLKEAHDFELNELKLYNEDRASARSREVELAKAGRPDYLHSATGYTVLLAFLLVEFSIIFLPIPQDNRELFVHLIGMVEGAFVGGLVFYYFGASKTRESK